MNVQLAHTLRKSITLPLLLSVIGLLGTLFNVWLASKLAPYAGDILKLDGRISAVEQKIDERSPLVESFIAVREKVDNLDKKTDRIERKVDIIIQQQVQLRRELQ